MTPSFTTLGDTNLSDATLKTSSYCMLYSTSTSYSALVVVHFDEIVFNIMYNH